MIGERIVGDNTDWTGFLWALRDVGCYPAGKRAVVLGAGGAARSVVYALASVGADVAVYNRHDERADSLVRDLRPAFPNVSLDAYPMTALRQETERRPSLLALHHPPFAVGIPGMDRLRCRGEGLLADWLSRHPEVAAVLCGHVHRFVATTFAGRPAATAPSPAHQIALSDGPLGWTAEPGGFLLHLWQPGERPLSHYLPSIAAPVIPYRD